MDSIDTTAGRPERKRRWYQFRLRTVLLAVIPLAVGSAWLARMLRWDDTVHLAISVDGVRLSSGQTVPLGPTTSLYALKDDLREQIVHRATGRGAVFTARIAVDPETRVGDVDDVIWACRELGIEHFDLRTAGERMRMYMPPGRAWDGPLEDAQLPPLRVWLKAADNGSLASVQLGDRALDDLIALSAEVRQIVGSDTGPGSIADTTVVELASTDGLKFEHVVEVYLAVSRHVEPDGTVRPPCRHVRIASLPASGREDAEGLRIPIGPP